MEQEEEVEDVEVEEEDPREHLNLVFIGHVGAYTTITFSASH